MSDIIPFMEKALVITCSRCKDEGIAYSMSADDAARWFIGQGWRFVVPKDRAKRLFCPQCVKDTKP